MKRQPQRIRRALTNPQRNDQRDHQCPEDSGRPAENNDCLRCFQGNVHWLFVRPHLFSAAWNDLNCSQIASFFCSKFARAASNEGRRSSPRFFHWPPMRPKLRALYGCLPLPGGNGRNVMTSASSPRQVCTTTILDSVNAFR